MSQWGLTDEDLKNIITLIRKNEISVIKAPTGSGKSTRLIEAINRVGDTTVFVVEPRVVAARSLAARMGSQLGKEKVGYAAEGEVKYHNYMIETFRRRSRTVKSPNTPIVYCTSGHLRRVLVSAISYPENLSRANLAFCDVIVIDEAHLRTLDLDVIMALWKYARDVGASVPRLVLVSATVSPVDTPFPKAPLYEVKVNSLPVTIEYVGTDYELGSRQVNTDMGKDILIQHKRIPIDKGSVWLVFCPGVGEVDAVKRVIDGAKDAKIEVLVAHAGTDTEGIFKPVPAGKRRIIIATNVAEMAVTIPNLSGIFDSMREKYNETSASGGTILKTDFVSKSSAGQRAGRTGRTTAGFVRRMCSQDFFSRLPDQRPPEISRIPIESIVVEALELQIDPRLLYGDQISEVRFQSAIRTLIEYKAVSKIGISYVVTPFGRFIGGLPLSIRNTLLLWKWIQLPGSHPLEGGIKPLFPIVSALCLIDNYGPSYFIFKDKNASDEEVAKHYRDYFDEYKSDSDLGILINMWQRLISTFKTLRPKTDALYAYCKKNSLSYRKIYDLFTIVRQTVNQLIRSGYTVELGPFTVDGLLQVLTPILHDTITPLTRQSGPNFIDAKGVRYSLEKFTPLTLQQNRTDRIIPLLIREISGGRIIVLFHPIRPMPVCTTPRITLPSLDVEGEEYVPPRLPKPSGVKMPAL